MCVSTWVVLMAINIACNSTRRMFWCPGSLYDIWVLLLGLYATTMLPSICTSEFFVSGMKYRLCICIVVDEI